MLSLKSEVTFDGTTRRRSHQSDDNVKPCDCKNDDVDDINDDNDDDNM